MNRPGLRIPCGSNCCLISRMMARLGGDGPQTSTPSFSAGGAAAITTWPLYSSARVESFPNQAAADGSASNDTHTTPLPAWAIKRTGRPDALHCSILTATSAKDAGGTEIGRAHV